MRLSLYLMFFILAVVFPFSSQAQTSIYGKIHMSADVVDIGAEKGNGISSNASRIGFKGKTDLNYGMKAIWKIETELDLADDNTLFKARNRYVGLNYGKSTFITGNHDTPFKTLGAKISVMPNSIADRRGILGRDSLTDNNFDVRAKSTVMLINRSFKAIEIRLMRSAGKVSASAGDTTPITSASLLYKSPNFMLGGAYEEQESNQTSGIRFFTGFAFGGTRLNAIYEQLDFTDSNAKKGWDRSVMGLSIVYKQGATSIKAQAYFAKNLESTTQSGGQMYAAGVFQQLAKPFEVYLIIAKIKNDTFASYTLTGSGHSDRYRPSSAGVRMHAVSFGGVYKF